MLDELLYADDMDKKASSVSKMQRAMDQVSQGLHVIIMILRSAQKDRGVHQPAHGKPYNEPTITLNGQN